MKQRRTIQLTRPLQIAFLVLLAVSVAQTSWWLLDQVRYTAQVRSRLLAAHGADAAAAQELVRTGARWIDVARLYPDLVIAADSHTVAVAPRVAAQLDREHFHRLNRYAWEGAFFLVVLMGAMTVVHRALSEEAELRRRQEGFLAAVSHELKSPLTSLQLSLETLAMRDPSTGRRAELVQRSLADIARLERTIRNILDTARLSAAKAQTHAERLVLAGEVTAVVDEVRDQAAEGGVTLTAHVDAAIAVQADRQSVRSILRNLLQNAITATAGAGGGRVQVLGSAADDRVRLEVRDDGIGFLAQEGPRLFDKFYRLNGAARERMTGTGLGLYLVRRCAELDGGRVSGESAGPGRGAVFVVEWPAIGRHAT